MGLHCEIFLTNNNGNIKSYFPGEKLTGNVTITSDSEVSVKGLKLCICGRGNVKFTESESRLRPIPEVSGVRSNNHSSMHSDFVEVEYIADEIYLDSTLNLFGYSGTSCSINPGKTSYPFQFILPHGLPSSFEGEYGFVLYTLEAVIGRSWAFDCKAKIKIHVIGIVDLSAEPSAQLPIEVAAHKTFGIFFQSGPLNITLKVPKGGAVPGEYIPFVAEIFNKSDKTVTESILIKQEFKYFALGKTKTVNKIVAQTLGHVLKPGGDHIWSGNVLRVPQLPPTRLGNCHIMDVKYELVLEMKVGGMGFNLSATAPFVIGTVPFRGVFFEPPPPYKP